MTLTDTHQPRSVGGATKPSVFVDGASGTTGLGIQERLHQQSDVVVKSIAEDKRKDAGAKRASMEEVDLVILCLPDAAAKETVALIDSMGAVAPKVLDASTAFRRNALQSPAINAEGNLKRTGFVRLSSGAAGEFAECGFG